MWLVSFLVHSSGTSRLPPGHILTEHASTSGMPEVVPGSSITVEPLDRIIFCVPSWVQMTPMKFVDVKSVPNMIGHVSTNYKRLCEWLAIYCKGAGHLAKSTHVFS